MTIWMDLLRGYQKFQSPTSGAGRSPWRIKTGQFLVVALWWTDRMSWQWLTNWQIESPKTFCYFLGHRIFLHPVGKDDAIWFTAPKQIFIHHAFDAQTFANDIAILRIPLAPCNQKNICPVCINDVPVGAAPSLDRLNNCFITGWGPLNAAGFPTGIRETQVKIAENAKCMKNLHDIGIVGFTITDSLFCTTSVNEFNSTNTKTCDSDGGAPLVCKDLDERWYLRGLITLGTDACSFESSLPLLMTDIGMFFNWIKIQVGNLNQPSSSAGRGVANRGALIRADTPVNVAESQLIPTGSMAVPVQSETRSLGAGELRRTLSDNWRPLQQFSANLFDNRFPL